MVKEKGITKLKHQARRYSIKEGVFSSAKISFGDRFIHPFAIAINTSNPLVALLTSISGLLGPLSQLISAQKFEKFSRKKVIMFSVLLESLMWLPFIVIAILFSKGIITSLLPILLLFSFSIYIIMVNASHPHWFSWMGDLVDEKYRGRWFSKRNLLVGVTAVILSIFASIFLDYFKKIDLAMIGFVILFSLALISRLISWFIFKKQYEPKFKFKKENYFSFWQFLKQAPKNNFGKFVIFRASYAFAGSMAGAVWAIYLLRYLEFNYFTYMIILISEIVFSLLLIGLWGKIADKYGNYKVLIITTLILPIIPILWVLHPSPIYLIFVPALIGGVAWGGFALATGNFIYDNVGKQKRSLAVSYYTMLWGIGVFVGAGISALLIKYLPTWIFEPIITIFIISSIARMIAVAWWVPKLKEVRKTKKLNSKKLKKTILKEIKPSLIEEAHQISSLGHYLKE
ncbi:MFS transporter [Candidatus Pacearchaeota archaeon]|nr:MFS transporter [Candidatus Pacearchaeota archaeon]